MRRGFASAKFDRDLQKHIASLGGQAAHRLGVAHQWNEETGVTAGRIGGLRSVRNRKIRRLAADGETWTAIAALVGISVDEAIAIAQKGRAS